MSIDAVSDTYWQTTRGTIRERCEAIFNQELLKMVFTVTSSDCKVKKARFYEFFFTLG
ncbi:hypothetical protein ABFA07_003043 [Porites harrisoni]